MSTPSKQTPRPSLTATAARNNNNQPQPAFLFDKQNYMWMIGGIVLLLIGFFLLSGGKSENPADFKYDELYGFRRLTLAPLVIMAGFAVEVYAIMKKPKDTDAPQGE
jgi:hypothetical protein